MNAAGRGGPGVPPPPAPRTSPRRSGSHAWGWLPWLALPVAPLQGIWVTRTVPRLDEAAGVTGSIGEGPRRLKVVALGDSVTAGYAIDHHSASVAGQLARRLAVRCGARVDWEVCAASGYTAGQALAFVEPEVLADADLVFVSVGVNDLKGFHSVRRFRRELGELFDAVLAAAPSAWVCLLGIPPLEAFPALPRPLADVLGWRGRVFDAVGAAAVAARLRALRIVTYEPLRDEMFAADGFHPSERLHAAFAHAVLTELEEAGAVDGWTPPWAGV